MHVYQPEKCSNNFNSIFSRGILLQVLDENGFFL